MWALQIPAQSIPGLLSSLWFMADMDSMTVKG